MSEQTVSTEPTMALPELMAAIDKVFGIDKMLADEGQDRVEIYYEQSRLGYEKFYSHQGCMHLALNMDGTFHPYGFHAQANAVRNNIARLGAGKVLELGAGMGFNMLTLAKDHPDVHFTGLDLMPRHVETIRKTAAEDGLENVTVLEGSFEPIPEDLGPFDIVFGVETLCYAQDVEAVARSIARVLRPGGWFVMFDVFRNPPLESYPEQLQTAVKLYEISMAVNDGFAVEQRWRKALRDAGLSIDPSLDRSAAVMPGLKVLQQRALPLVNDWKARLAVKAMPRYLACNAVSALLGPYVYATDALPEGVDKGPLSYWRLSATKPAA